MEYIYVVDSASLVLKMINYCVVNPHVKDTEITVIHQINGWIIRLKSPYLLTAQQYGDAKAFFSELGFTYRPNVQINLVFCSLDMGESVVTVMEDYNVAIISHGSADITEMEAFRLQFSRGLGYRPETLA
ncbi:MAG: hypothetical protein IGQ45_12305 [Cyanobacterium sp. T60_A2020_053]|nr:hypothetical protein [Cyanobacterium sp. T60_A2020_053]